MRLLRRIENLLRHIKVDLIFRALREVICFDSCFVSSFWLCVQNGWEESAQECVKSVSSPGGLDLRGGGGDRGRWMDPKIL